MVPDIVILPMRLASLSVNHIAPSGPAVIREGNEPAAGSGKVVTTPAGVIRVMASIWGLAIQTFPSGPAASPLPNAAESSGNSVTSPDVVMRPIRSATDSPTGPCSLNQRAPSGPAAMFQGLPSALLADAPLADASETARAPQCPRRGAGIMVFSSQSQR